MRYLSLFSGIEACSVAWKPLGWECAAVAEIDPFPSAVLQHRYPDTPNLGDITKITRQQIEQLGPIDLVVGGFPCQDLSVAGKRKGLNNADGTLTRSGLFFTAETIAEWAAARWLVVENVPGLFSSNEGRDFAAVVGELSGADFDVPPDGWANAGAALGPKGLIEWATLDAQYCRVDTHPRAVPQRRRRVFIVRDSGGQWQRRPPIFLIPQSLRGDPAPSRRQGQRIAPTVEARVNGGGGGWGTDFMSGGGLAATDASHTLGTQCGGATEDGTGRGSPIIPVGTFQETGKGWWNDDPAAQTLRDGSQGGPRLANLVSVPAVCPTISESGGHAPPGDNMQSVLTLIPTTSPSYVPAVAPCRTSRDGKGERQDIEEPSLIAEAIAFKPSHYTRDKDGAPSTTAPPLSADADKGDQDTLVLQPSFVQDAADPLVAGEQKTCTHEGANNFRTRNVVAFAQNTRDEVRLQGGDGEVAGALGAEPGMKQQTYLAVPAEPTVKAFSAMPMNSGKDFVVRETEVSQPLMAAGPSHGDQGGDFVVQPTIAFTCKDSGSDASEEISPTLRAGGAYDSNGGVMPAVMVGFNVCPDHCGGDKSGQNVAFVTETEVARTLDCTGADVTRKQGGTGVAMINMGGDKGKASVIDDGSAFTLATNGPHAVAIPIIADADRENSSAKTPSPDAEGNIRLRDPGIGIGVDGDPMFTLQATKPHAVAIQDVRGLAKKQNGAGVNTDGVAYTADGLATQGVATFQQSSLTGKGTLGYDDSGAAKPTKTQTDGQMLHQGTAVRRLTPTECERLQGFPDGWTLIPMKGGKMSADGPRYKALGNSMATNCMRWIGKRLMQLEALTSKPSTPS